MPATIEPAPAPRVVPDIEAEILDEIQDEATQVRVKTAYSKGRIEGLKQALELVRRKQGAA